MDVKPTFLHGNLEKENLHETTWWFSYWRQGILYVYVEENFIRFEADSKTYKKFESFMSEQDYKKTTSNLCNFIIKFSNDDFIIILMYLDDIFIVDKNISIIDKLN